MFNFSTAKTTRRSVELFQGTLDLVFEGVPLDTFDIDVRYQAIARECAHSQDVALAAIAIDRELTIWAVTSCDPKFLALANTFLELDDYVKDRESKTISVFPPALKSNGDPLKYAQRLKREKFPNYEIIRQGWVER